MVIAREATRGAAAWLALALTLAPPATAQASGAPFSDEDWSESFWAGVGGAATVGVVGGLGLGVATSLTCRDDRPSEWGCSEVVPIVALFGGYLLAHLGVVGGVYGYGESTGHDGSLILTALGTLAGALLHWGSVYLASESGDGFLAAALAIVGAPLPAFGASRAYGWSLDVAPAGPTRVSLVEVDPAGDVRLGLPAPLPGRDPEGGLQVTVPLLSGRW
ncbi:MAG: hypothetical protein H6706_00675 [Myxococcales bacterium]|nr:hypothetical protein [Myxococcales bacterium]